MTKRTPPQSSQAESAVVAGAFLNPAAYRRADGVLVTTDAFYSGKRRHVWSAMGAVLDRGEDIDMVTVGAELRRRGMMEDIGGEVGLSEMCDGAPSGYIESVCNYAKEVRRLYVIRQVIGLGTEMVSAAYDVPGDLPEFGEQTLRALADVFRGAAGKAATRMLGDVLMEEVLDPLQNDEEPHGHIPSGIETFDKRTGGYPRGVLSVVGARPANGKSSWLIQSAIGAATAGHRVLVFPLEDTPRHWAGRAMAQRARVEASAFTNGDASLIKPAYWPHVIQAAKGLKGLPVEFDTVRTGKVDRIVSEIYNAHARHDDLAMVIVDYVQMLRDPGHRGNRNYEIESAVRKLKDAAAELDLAVVLASQLNRKCEERKEPAMGWPMLSDLRDCGDLEQAARCVVLLWAAENYKVEMMQDPRTMQTISSRGLVLAHVAKLSHGKAGADLVRFERPFTLFSPMED